MATNKTSSKKELTKEEKEKLMQMAEFAKNVPWDTSNAKYRPKSYQTFTEPSLAVPDQSLTIKEILNRYTKGLPVEGYKNPTYNEESEGIRAKGLDLVDQQELKMSTAEKIEHLTTEVKKAKAKKKPVKPEEAIEEMAKDSPEGQ